MVLFKVLKERRPPVVPQGGRKDGRGGMNSEKWKSEEVKKVKSEE